MSIKRLSLALGLLALVLGLGACGGTKYPPAPVEVDPFEPKYLIGPGDG